MLDLCIPFGYKSTQNYMVWKCINLHKWFWWNLTYKDITKYTVRIRLYNVTLIHRLRALGCKTLQMNHTLEESILKCIKIASNGYHKIKYIRSSPCLDYSHRAQQQAAAIEFSIVQTIRPDWEYRYYNYFFFLSLHIKQTVYSVELYATVELAIWKFTPNPFDFNLLLYACV